MKNFDLRDNIKKVIASHNLTSVAVAKSLNLSKGSFSRIVSGNPTVETLVKIADAIGCDIGDFFLDELSEPAVKLPGSLTCPHCGKPIKVELKKED